MQTPGNDNIANDLINQLMQDYNDDPRGEEGPAVATWANYDGSNGTRWMIGLAAVRLVILLDTICNALAILLFSGVFTGALTKASTHPDCILRRLRIFRAL